MGASASLLMATITFDDDMPARCWMAPLMPAATYSVGETVLPVWPTWYWWSTQPASTTAREAPTAAPSEAASSSTRWKFSGPFSPRPPDTMICASVSSTLPPALAWTDTTRARAVVSTRAVTVSNLREASGAANANTLGRSVAICGSPSQRTVAKAFPAYTGRRASSRPSLTSSLTTSETRPALARAATRGATSLPIAVNGISTAAGFSWVIT